MWIFVLYFSPAVSCWPLQGVAHISPQRRLGYSPAGTKMNRWIFKIFLMSTVDYVTFSLTQFYDQRKVFDHRYGQTVLHSGGLCVIGCNHRSFVIFLSTCLTDVWTCTLRCVVETNTNVVSHRTFTWNVLSRKYKHPNATSSLCTHRHFPLLISGAS